ncbi:hypothetical protein CAI21_19845 [Alkalilimnicola ehrlichii]|nr:glycosyltransferase [Alkalilimnicola ehrlichii]RFA25149.1 hypothetical protein CAI21_19845 [Alkalilimnicola ehrlichii]
MISSLTKEKGHRFALEALRALVSEPLQIQLLIVGDGPESDGLRNEVQHAGLAENVIFTGSRQDIPQLLQAIDIFLLPSLKEGLPMALLEAMASGLAVVGSSVGDVGTTIEQDRSGLLVPPGDSDALRQAIKRLVLGPDLRARFGLNARRRVERHFSAEAMTQAYCELYSRYLPIVENVADASL